MSRKSTAAAAIGAIGDYQIACRSAWLDAGEREANRSVGWADPANVRDAIERGDCDDCTFTLGLADADEAESAYVDAERAEPIGYVARQCDTSWEVLTIRRDASGMRAGIVERYYWPRGGW